MTDVSEATTHTTVLDIGAEQLGHVYAQALLAAATRAGVADEVLDQLAQIVDEYLKGSPQLAAAFASPRVEDEEKNRVIERLFGESIHPLVLQLMKVMVRRGRLGYLAAVRNAAVKLRDEAMGRVAAEIRTAVPLDDELRGEVTRRLSESMGKEVRLRESVDPSLLGGMVVRLGDTVFDASVAGRIDRLGRAASRGFAHRLLERAERFASES
jgi:F-type H+-transporting ATPase subunit delta